MDPRAPTTGRGALPNLSLAKAHRKADRYALGDLHRQSNTAAKQAILQELHSSMQLRAEKIRLQRKGQQNFTPIQMSDESVGPLRDAPENGTVGANRGSANPHGDMHLTTGYPKHVTFSEPHLDPRSTPSKGQSRIPVPVRRTESSGQKVESSVVPGRRPKVLGRKGEATGAGQVAHQYTWDQRGRLHELRVRCLARKCFTLWKLNALTGVKPSVIRKHYNSRLLRKMFSEWREFWWTQRREWTLMIRAEYHHRYKVYQHVWQAWKAFVLRERVKAAKRKIAEDHDSRVVLLRAMSAWKEYHQQRRAKGMLRDRALRFRGRTLLQFHWDAWRGAIDRRTDQGEAETFALQYWADSVTQKAWDVWRRRCREKQRIKEKENQAREFYERSLVARCYYRGLVQYTLHRRDKKREKARAAELHQRRLLMHALQHWYQRWFTQRSLAQRQEQVDHHGNQCRMRRIIIHWKFYVQLLHDERLKEDRARRHHNMQLMKFVLMSLKLALVQRRLKIRRTLQAREHYEEMLVKQCWNRWMLQCERSEELKLFAATRKARLMYRKRVLGGAIQKWCNYARWRRYRRAQYLRAEVHYELRLLPKCLHSLRQNVELQKRKRELAMQASQFHRETLLGQCFFRWCRSYQTSQDVRMMERMAFLHHESVMAQKFFSEWRERTRAKLKESEQLHLAIDHHCTAVCSRALHRWVDFMREARQRSDFERMAATHSYLKTIKMAFGIWREYVAQRRCKAAKRKKADSHFQGKQLRLVFTAWKGHCQEMRRVYEVAADKERRAKLKKLEYAFTEWRLHTEDAREEKRLQEIALTHQRKKLMHKVLGAWHMWAQKHAADSAIKTWRVEQMHSQLGRGKLHRALLAWRDWARMAAEDARLEEKANNFHNRKLKERSLKRWQQFRVLCVKKQLMTRQALWMNKIRMQLKFFSRWKHQFGEAQEEERKTVMALWLWSMRLQQRTLHSWIQYTGERRRKKSRIAEALEQRRLELLKEGVRQWLAVAANLAERRATIAAKHYAQSSYKSYQVVQRCATHWRQKTLANRSKRESQQKLPPRRRVTFADQEPSGRGQGSKVTESFLDPKSTNVSIQSVEVVQSTYATRSVPDPAHSSVLLPKPLTSSHLPARSLSVEHSDVNGMPSNMIKPVTGKVRPQPRRPDFLRDSLKREGLWNQSPVKAQLVKDQHRKSPQDDRLPAFAPTGLGHPSELKWGEPSPASQPMTVQEPTISDVPFATLGGATGIQRDCQESKLGDVPWQSVQSGASFEPMRRDEDSHLINDSLRRVGNISSSEAGREEREIKPFERKLSSCEDESQDKIHQRKVIVDTEDKNVLQYPTVDSRTNKNEVLGGFHQQKIAMNENEYDGKPTQGEWKTDYAMKHTVLLPPSAFTGGASYEPTPKQGELQSNFDKENRLPPESTTSVPLKSHPRSGSGSGHLARKDSTVMNPDAKEDVYAEIQRLKRTLQGFQEKKRRLKELQKQEAELQGWLKELNLSPSVEDSAGLLIGDELTQVQDEILSLTDQVRMGKPRIKGLLARISQLTQHATV